MDRNDRHVPRTPQAWSDSPHSDPSMPRAEEDTEATSHMDPQHGDQYPAGDTRYDADPYTDSNYYATNMAKPDPNQYPPSQPQYQQYPYGNELDEEVDAEEEEYGQQDEKKPQDTNNGPLLAGIAVLAVAVLGVIAYLIFGSDAAKDPEIPELPPTTSEEAPPPPPPAETVTETFTEEAPPPRDDRDDRGPQVIIIPERGGDSRDDTPAPLPPPAPEEPAPPAPEDPSDPETSTTSEAPTDLR